jgi:hypothetical protein
MTKGILVLLALAVLFFWGGPLVGVAFSILTFTVPILFILFLSGLGVWKTLELFARR